MIKNTYSIISGGMDSTLATYIAKEKYDEVVAIYFDWGQKSSKDEYIAVQKICNRLEIDSIITIYVPINEWDKSCLTQGDPKVIDNDFMVPERNLIFISLAASYARANGGGIIIVGFNKDDGGYDTNEKFVRQLNGFFKQGSDDLKSFSESYLYGTAIKIEALLINFDKARIKMELEKAGLFDLTYSCYAASGPCGKCSACKKREGKIISYGSK